MQVVLVSKSNFSLGLEPLPANTNNSFSVSSKAEKADKLMKSKHGNQHTFQKREEKAYVEFGS